MHFLGKTRQRPDSYQYSLCLMKIFTIEFVETSGLIRNEGRTIFSQLSRGTCSRNYEIKCKQLAENVKLNQPKLVSLQIMERKFYFPRICNESL